MVSLHDEMERCLVERQTYRLQHAWSLAASAKRVKHRGRLLLAVDFHSRDDKDQLRQIHFRHSNGNHNSYLQFEAQFMIF